MKRKLLTIITLCLIFALSGIVAVGCGGGSSEPKATEGLEFYEYRDCYEVRGIGSATATDIVVPSTYKDKPVTKIGSTAFYKYNIFGGGSNITSIYIPDSITEIGSSAFENCKQLKKVRMSENIELIGDNAFLSCDQLEYNVKNEILYLGNDQNPYVAAMGRESNYLTEINVEQGCKYIEKDTFRYCRDAQTAIIPEGVKYIGEFAFYSCTSLKTVSIPTSINYLAYNAFNGCDSIECYEAGGVKYLGNETNNYVVAVKAISKDIQSVQIENGCKIIFNSAFKDCKSLSSVTLPNGIIEICGYAFEGCSALRRIDLPNSIKELHGSFYLCSGLEEVILSSELEVISTDTFAYCYNLETIKFNGTTEQWNNIIKYMSWNKNVPADVVKCSNGSVELN